jgi:hypothetical protein
MGRAIVEIDQWTVEEVDGTKRLIGMVKGHPRFGDSAEPITSSPVMSLDRVAGIAKTKYTTYKLATERKANG